MLKSTRLLAFSLLVLLSVESQAFEISENGNPVIPDRPIEVLLDGVVTQVPEYRKSAGGIWEGRVHLEQVKHELTEGGVTARGRWRGEDRRRPIPAGLWLPWIGMTGDFEVDWQVSVVDGRLQARVTRLHFHSPGDPNGEAVKAILNDRKEDIKTWLQAKADEELASLNLVEAAVNKGQPKLSQALSISPARAEAIIRTAMPEVMITVRPTGLYLRIDPGAELVLDSTGKIWFARGKTRRHVANWGTMVHLWGQSPEWLYHGNQSSLSKYSEIGLPIVRPGTLMGRGDGAIYQCVSASAFHPVRSYVPIEVWKGWGEPLNEVLIIPDLN